MVMTRSSAGPRTCSCPSERLPGLTCWSARCLRNSCSARRRSLPSTPIIARARRVVRLALPLLLTPLLLAASAPVQPAAEPLDQTLKEARAEQAAAENQAARLLRVADQARGQAAKLQAQQLAAAQALEASEAQITAADAQLRLVSARLASQRAQLQREQQPVSSL